MKTATLIGINRHRLTIDGEGVTTLVAFHESKEFRAEFIIRYNTIGWTKPRHIECFARRHKCNGMMLGFFRNSRECMMTIRRQRKICMRNKNLLSIVCATALLLSCQSNKSFEIVVAGGGASGTCAAIQSARLGTKTLLIERTACTENDAWSQRNSRVQNLLVYPILL